MKEKTQLILGDVVCKLGQRDDAILALSKCESCSYISLRRRLLNKDLLGSIIKLDLVFNLIHLKYNEADLYTLIFVRRVQY